jgi:hypothetical protein
MKPRLYLETTIPSYLAARRSRDLRLAADQETTLQWWEAERHDYELFISQAVVTEVSQGDVNFAAARLDHLRDLPLLPRTPQPPHSSRTCSPAASFRRWRKMTRRTSAWPPRTAWIFC